VDGEKQLPFPKGRGTCPCCGSLLIAKCGQINAHHWAHEARADCDPWSEPIGPWHLAWQGLVLPEFVEVVKEPHRADIFNGRTVIELQHSSISAEDIAAREAFYGDMVWLFDATHRFAYTKSGERAFFSFGQTKHLDLCKKPVFLDFGFDVVQVEGFTDAIMMVSGLGLTRSREWFADVFLSDVRQPGTSLSRFVPQLDATDPWSKKSPVWKLKHDTKWMDVAKVVTIPKWTEYIKLNYYHYQVGDSQNKQFDHDNLIDRHPDIANDWTKDSLRQMKEFLSGEAIILGGLMRVLPHPAFVKQPRGTVSATEHLLRLTEDHIRAGRVPVLKDETKEALLEKTRQGEVAQYGRLLRPQAADRSDDQKSLFD
jgi:hypothetical protein